MNIKGVEHIALNVRDLDKSVKFYRDILGFEVSTTVDMDGFTITYMIINQNQRLELFNYETPKKAELRADDDIGLKHFAFEVEDVPLHEKLLEKANVKITLPTTELPELGVRVLLFLDPNGVIIEFCEKL